MKTFIVVVGIFCAVLGLLLLSSKTKKQPLSQPEPLQKTAAISYLPLGDSYTIGQSVAQGERFPDQLVSKLRADGVDIGIVANPSVTGFTTQDLIDNELPLLERYKPDFVTVLIGVNDYVQGLPHDTFVKNLRFILDAVQAKVAKNKIVLLTIPDYAKTPAGAKYGDPATATANIEKFNQTILEENQKRDLLAVDIYAISQQVSQDPTLVARDGLHPSGVQYKMWADKLYDALQTAKTFKP